MVEAGYPVTGTSNTGNLLLVSRSRVRAAAALELLGSCDLQTTGLAVACSISSALLLLESEPIDVVVLVLERADPSAIGSVERLAQISPDTQVLVVGVDAESELARELRAAGVSQIFGSLESSRARLPTVVRTAITTRRANRLASLVRNEALAAEVTGSVEGRSGGASVARSAIAEIKREELERQVLELEDELHRSRRLEAVGRLACRVAHDFNNLLTAIMGFGDLLQPHLEGDETGQRYVDGICHAAERAGTLSQQLLAFSRQQMPRLEAVELNDCIESLEGMLKSVMGEMVAFETRLDPAAEAALADRAQIEHAIMNLAINARDAMPAGGRFVLETTNSRIDTPLAIGSGTLASGSYAVLTASDTGIGMTPETLQRAFEPFFTTKDVGKGNGLGLANVQLIVEQAGGGIDIDSIPGLGTTFRVYLPHVESTAHAESTALAELSPLAEAPALRSAPIESRETILLVEDDEMVRNLACEILREAGYTVVDVPGAHEAMRAATGAGARAQLLLTDVVMPSMNGKELADRLVAARPTLRVLFMTGYTDLALVKGNRLAERGGFLQKPFTPRVLVDKVREILDASAS